jgi:hypothetical protein
MIYASTASTSEALELEEGGNVHAFRRLRLLEEEPIAIETTYFPAQTQDSSCLARDHAHPPHLRLVRRVRGVGPRRLSR